MKRTIVIFFTLCLLAPGSWAQNGAVSAPDSSSKAQADDPAQLRQEIDQLKKSLGALEQRLAAQEKLAQSTSKTDENTVAVDDLEKRVSETEKHQALDRLSFSGDYRFEAHSIWGHVPARLDGMAMQNLMVKTLFMTTPTAQGGWAIRSIPAC